MAEPTSDPGAGAPRPLRPKGSAKLRFGKDKIFRTLSGSEHSAPSYSASSNSLASSDGEELTTWRIETHDGRRSSDDPAVPSASPAARPAPLQPVTYACASLADLEVLATIGAPILAAVESQWTALAACAVVDAYSASNNQRICAWARSEPAFQVGRHQMSA